MRLADSPEFDRSRGDACIQFRIAKTKYSALHAHLLSIAYLKS